LSGLSFDASVCKRQQAGARRERMSQATDRRTSQRFTMNLPVVLTPRSGEAAAAAAAQRRAQTRDVSFRGLYFLTEENYQVGSPIELILTLPKEITMAGDVHIRCYARVVRVDPREESHGIAARIERYEFLPAAQ